jgi:hypothetical protein
MRACIYTFMSTHVCMHAHTNFCARKHTHFFVASHRRIFGDNSTVFCLYINTDTHAICFQTRVNTGLEKTTECIIYTTHAHIHTYIHAYASSMIHKLLKTVKRMFSVLVNNVCAPVRMMYIHAHKGLQLHARTQKHIHTHHAYLRNIHHTPRSPSKKNKNRDCTHTQHTHTQSLSI